MVARSSWFSLLDLRSGYWQIPLAPDASLHHQEGLVSVQSPSVLPLQFERLGSFELALGALRWVLERVVAARLILAAL